ncbi:MAG: hypothetical protein JWP31_1157 [Aeromicrobium sp.]|nr:hypothetical protein [Aeromicrobium sp.]
MSASTPEVTREKLPPTRATPPATSKARGASKWLVYGERYGLLLVIVAVIITFSAMYPDSFATSNNWRTILASQSVTVVIALALMVPLLAGNFDLSVGSVAVLSSIIAAGLMSRHDVGLGWAILLVLLMAAAIGMVNGALVSRLGLDGFIATLGTSTILGGLIVWYSEGLSIASGISDGLVEFGAAEWLGAPKLAWVALIVALLVGYCVTQTPIGRKLVSIGSSAPAATLVGIPVGLMVFSTYVISALMGGMAGILLLAQQGSANPSGDGIGILLPAVAAVFLGASTWNPGQFNVVGTVLGLLLVAVTVSGLTLAGAEPWVNPVTYGSALTLAVAASAWSRRRRRGA